MMSFRRSQLNQMKLNGTKNKPRLAAEIPARIFTIPTTREMACGGYHANSSILLVEHAMGHAVALAAVLPASLFFRFAEIADF